MTGKKTSFKKIKIISLTILSSFLMALILSLHPFGMLKAIKMDDYFLKNAQTQTGSNNTVSSIVFDYRGLDTLGEATVLFTAVLGIYLILIPLKIKNPKVSIEKKKFSDKKIMSKIIKTAGLIILSPIIIFGFYIISHGHLTPGGGFQGGVIIASASVLILIIFKNSLRLSKLLFSIFESVGLTFFIVLAFLGIFKNTFFYNFLANSGGFLGRTIHFGSNIGYLQSGGVIPLMNFAVGIEVSSALSLIIILMIKQND